MNNSFINNNNELSSFNKEDLNYLFNLLSNMLIEYRISLNLPSFVTFGVEIEYEALYHTFVDKYVKNNLLNWESKDDRSLYFGGEVTSPVMIDKKEYWLELKKICDYLKKNNANVRRNAGGHVHIGVNIFNNDLSLWTNFIKLYVSYEHILYRFGYGECISSRKHLDTYAKFVGSELFKKIKLIENTNSMYDLEFILNNEDKKFDGINFKHVCFNNKETYRFNTIEFRFPNGTKNEVIWQNNINTFSKMMLAISEEKINPKFLDYKLRQNQEKLAINNIKTNYIYLEDALEFADLVFDNNLDKLYFLKQYFKNFDYVLNNRHSLLTKSFTLNK